MADFRTSRMILSVFPLCMRYNGDMFYRLRYISLRFEHSVIAHPLNANFARIRLLNLDSIGVDGRFRFYCSCSVAV